MANTTQTITTNIVVLGGGGFSEEAESMLLDDYILGLSGSACPRVCFLPTASGDATAYIEKFYASFPPTRAQATHLSLFSSPVGVDARSFLLEQDVIYVGGGNTVNLLALWRAHGLDDIIHDAWHNGVVLAGISAGMVCWFEEFVTDSYLGGALSPCRIGLGLIAGSACPHYDDPKRRMAYRNFIETNVLSAGIGAEGCVGLHFINGVLAKVVTSISGHTAYMVKKIGNIVVEEPINPSLLRSGQEVSSGDDLSEG